MSMASGTDIRPWKVKKITVPQNMSTAQDILAWLRSELVNEEYIIMMCSRDNVDMSTWTTDDFIFTGWGNINTSSNAMIYLRNRGISVSSMYLQNRSYSNNETTNVYQGETFTIFYQ